VNSVRITTRLVLDLDARLSHLEQEDVPLLLEPARSSAA
jgi:hypothetical protein